MKISINPVVASRIKTAWGKLDPVKRAQIQPTLDAAHQQAISIAQTKAAPLTSSAPNELMMAQSILNNDKDQVINSLESGVVFGSAPDGVMVGTGKYEQLDPGWLESFACYLESLIAGKADFVNSPQAIDIPNTVKIGMAGDWGTGDWRTGPNFAPSTNVRTQMNALALDITIHLGDVYYAGTGDEEKHLLVNMWPQGTKGSYALNSNHEMYSGAKPYFAAINDYPFQMQKGCSYFVLQNAYWVIVGMDSAFFASEDTLYRDGRLYEDGKPNQQIAFLTTTVAAAKAAGKKTILLTHHNGLDESNTTAGEVTNALWNQVMGAYPVATGPDYWYWGHAHTAVVFKPRENIQCRCCGHGGIPWASAPRLDPKTNPDIIWTEDQPANDPDIKRLMNGFAVLYLDGPNISEVFYNENGGVAWPPKA